VSSFLSGDQNVADRWARAELERWPGATQTDVRERSL
jgi:hypothetical protein